MKKREKIDRQQKRKIKCWGKNRKQEDWLYKIESGDGSTYNKSKEGKKQHQSEPARVRVSQTKWKWARPGENEPDQVRMSQTKWEWARPGESKPGQVRVSQTRWEWASPSES